MARQYGSEEIDVTGDPIQVRDMARLTETYRRATAEKGRPPVTIIRESTAAASHAEKVLYNYQHIIAEARQQLPEKLYKTLVDPNDSDHQRIRMEGSSVEGNVAFSVRLYWADKPDESIGWITNIENKGGVTATYDMLHSSTWASISRDE
jgi:hypothetical protein